MSVEQEVSELILGAQGRQNTEAVDALDLTVKEVNKLLEATNDSLHGCCMEIESASTRHGLMRALRKFDKVMRFFLVAVKDKDHEQLGIQAVCSLGLSSCFEGILESAASLQKGITSYKTTVARDLAAVLQNQKQQACIDDELNEQLLSQILPEPIAPPQVKLGNGSSVAVAGIKRGVSAVVLEEDVTRVTKKKKSAVPALAALHLVPGGGGDGSTIKKNVLLTREKLRSGLHDPKGLLDLEGQTTSAIERTKRLELLKNAGLLVKTRGSRPFAKRSFSDRLNDAKVRLELGLGGQSVSDTLIFGAKVLSSPGFLTNKNISEVENGIVEGNTTWKHQDAYCKMVIAGCLNQSKRILQKYDEVLYGSSPELLIEPTHTAIRNLLKTEEAYRFVREAQNLGDAAAELDEKFVKKIVEAVEPIIPVTLRNKSLDGTYLREALHMLGAAELLFAQYQSDVREHSNPAGFVGLAAAMHSEFESAAFDNNELRPFEDFMKDMKSVYQTSLGLGTPFAKDSFPGTRRRRGGRGRTSWRNRRFPAAGINRAQVGQGFNAGGFLDNGLQPNITGRGTGRGSSIPISGRGLCYGYQNGTCHRGASCRFLHMNN